MEEEKKMTLLCLNAVTLQVHVSTILNARPGSMLRKILKDHTFTRMVDEKYVVDEHADLMVLVLEAAATGGKVARIPDHIYPHAVKDALHNWGVDTLEFTEPPVLDPRISKEAHYHMLAAAWQHGQMFFSKAGCDTPSASHRLPSDVYDELTKGSLKTAFLKRVVDYVAPSLDVVEMTEAKDYFSICAVDTHLLDPVLFGTS